MKERSSEYQILNDVANHYEPQTDFDRYLSEFGAELILRDFCGARMLEVGCSAGVMTRVFAQRVPDLHVVDASHIYLESLRQELSDRVTFINSLAEDYEPNVLFDGVVLASLLEHVKDPVAVLKHSVRWLKEAGSLFIIVPNRNSIHRQVGVAMGMLEHVGSFSERDHMLNHRRIYDLPLLESHVQDAGYRIADIKGIMVKPLSNQQMLSWPPEIIRALIVVGLDKPDIAAQIFARCTR
jgi:2-polyprenyl-3-methyl-5-hydroxy-6-metoxy-1,4-benzoquinol methylase